MFRNEATLQKSPESDSSSVSAGATMTANRRSDPIVPPSASIETPSDRLRKIERREWLLWTVAVTITLLLTAGIVSFLLPMLQTAEETGAAFTLKQEITGLLGIVLLFDLYTVYQQLQIHRIRRRLMESEEIFRLISENAADMIAVVDGEGNRLYNSASYERVLGYSVEELKSTSAFAQIHPEDVARVKAASEETRRTGSGNTVEYRMRHKDGSWRVFESTASIIYSPKGPTGKIVIVNRDVTERRDAVEALKRSEASFRSVVEHAPYGICRVDREGNLLEANPALHRLLGYEDSQVLLSRNLSRHIFAESGDFARLSQLLESSNDFRDVELAWRKLDGSPLTVHCSGRRIPQSNQLAGSMELFAQDVTERMILERQLRMAGKMEAIGRLSGGIAHDFNNLLGVIIGYSKLIRQRVAPQHTELAEFAEEVEKAGQRAAALTRQLLAFSRQQILTPIVLDLNALVSDMQKMLPRLIGEDLTLEIDLKSDLGTVKADRSQIEQVVMNLAVNARDAMPAGGTLRIETANAEIDEMYARHHAGARPGHYVLLSVSDSGTGMSPETVTHIFEPFFTTKELGKGTGLGLATIYGIVKQSGGYIWVDSKLGEGSSFKIFLPRRCEEPTPQDSPGSSSESKGHETILVVEDAEPLRKLACRFLENHGYKVLQARDGDEALSIAANSASPIDLLLTDVVMPGINGRVLAERLLPRYAAMKVLYMSGYTDSFIAGHGVLERGTSLIHKPFTEEALLEKVKEVLEARTELAGLPFGVHESLAFRGKGD